jgi:multisubunit Na+/H+ antiporter MnhE subunit
LCHSYDIVDHILPAILVFLFFFFFFHIFLFSVRDTRFLTVISLIMAVILEDLVREPRTRKRYPVPFSSRCIVFCVGLFSSSLVCLPSSFD